MVQFSESHHAHTHVMSLRIPNYAHQNLFQTKAHMHQPVVRSPRRSSEPCSSAKDRTASPVMASSDSFLCAAVRDVLLGAT